MLLKTLDTAALIPPIWAGEAVGDAVIGEPSITRHGNAMILACLVARTPTGSGGIALCRVGPDMNIIPDSAVPTTDHPAFATLDHPPSAPRLIGLRDTLYLVFDVETPPAGNRIHIVAIDPATLLPTGPVRLVETTGHRRQSEHGWLFFDHDDGIFAISDLAPLTILRVDMAGDRPVVCHPFARHN